MNEQTNVKILELMASKICHDLISPIGAIANGVEFMEEMGTDTDDEVTELISFSARQASAKLQAMRLAYGAGGADSSIKPEDVHKIFGAFISGENRVTQNWDPYTPLDAANNKGFAKILMNLLFLAHDCLPKGGNITVTADDQNQIIITATGENAGLKDGFLNALENKTPIDALEPKLIHSYLTGLLTQNYNFALNIDDEKEDATILILSATD